MNTNTNSNLTPAQRVWKSRRARWARHDSVLRDSRGNIRAIVTTWADAVKNGNERSFLKREGEGD